MAAALQAAAAALIAAKQAHTDAQLQACQTDVAMRSAELALIEAYHNDESDDIYSAVACNGFVLLIAEEYWELEPGNKVAIHRLRGAPS